MQKLLSDWKKIPNAFGNRIYSLQNMGILTCGNRRLTCVDFFNFIIEQPSKNGCSNICHIY